MYNMIQGGCDIPISLSHLSPKDLSNKKSLVYILHVNLPECHLKNLVRSFYHITHHVITEINYGEFH